MGTTSAAKLSLILFLVVVYSVAVWAQTATTSVLGQVLDQQGAAIVAAKITAVNAATGLTRIEHTDPTGSYSLSSLPPGRYHISVEMTGFRTAQTRNVELLVNTATRLDFVLQIGTREEMVEVSAVSPVLNTTDASVGNAFSEQQIRNLPLEGRSVVGLLSLQAGAVFAPTTVERVLFGIPWVDSRQGSVSGSHGDQTNVTLDGVDVNDPNGYAYSSALRVTLDSIQEFRVTTTNYGADQGRSSAAQVSLITKSGSNAFHGSAYGYHRNTAWSSNTYFNKASQLWNAEHGVATENKNKPPLLQKTIWGASLGGPVFKDRFFFFVNLENLRDRRENSVQGDVPSDTLRDGILIYPCADPAACPASQVAGLSGTAHNIAAGKYGLGPAQLAQLDPLGLGASAAVSQYFRQYPHPNATGQDGYNLAGYRWAAPVSNNQYIYIARLDFKLDHSGRHTLSWRGNLQDDSSKAAPLFPGQAPAGTGIGNSRGMMLGYTAVISPHLINSFRYGYTRIGEATAGPLNGPSSWFSGLSYYESQIAGSTRVAPIHNFVEDVTWSHGKHTIQLGANIRFIDVITSDKNNTWPTNWANAGWMMDAGHLFLPGTACPAPQTAYCLSLPLISEGAIPNYGLAWIDVLGVMSFASVSYNYDKSGAVAAFGTPLKRHFTSHAWEYYWQDSWRLKPNLNLVFGLRWSLNSPPWEVNGNQVAPTINMGKWFEQRRRDMLAGIPDNQTPLVSFDLAGAANGKPGYYRYDKNNFAPRIAFSYSPGFNYGWLRRLTGGPEKMTVRGGYSLLYDNMGMALADALSKPGQAYGASFGLSTTLSSPFGTYSDPNLRFVSASAMPAYVPVAPPGGFPATPPTRTSSMSAGIDNSLITPYAHVFNFMIGRELPGGMVLEVGYVGRRGRDLIVRHDLAQYLNLTDTKSGSDYFSATKVLIDAGRNIPLLAPASAYASIAPIPYFENMFPGAAGTYDGVSMTATQYLARRFRQANGDYTNPLYMMDEYCLPTCSALGPFAFFNQQWDLLATLSTIGHSEYHALQATLRKRFSNGLDFTFNYTYSKSSDMTSGVERGNAYANFYTGGVSEFIVNSWSPAMSWSPSDFDLRHQINANWTVELPFGRKKLLAGNAPGWLNAMIGDWQWSGIWRWSSGFPFDIMNCSCWATNWNFPGNAQPKDPHRLPATGHYQFVVGDTTTGPLMPSMFKDPASAYADYFRRDYPGEGGRRNYLRGDGYFTIDVGLGKTWSMPYKESHKLKFRWEVFNLTNSTRFDVGNMNGIPDNTATFGSYNGVLNGCDNAAGRCMQASMRYEF